MDIPDSRRCKAWAEALGAADGSATAQPGQRIRANVEDDPCVPVAAEQRFFELVEQAPTVVTERQAIELGNAVVSGNRSELTRTGKRVPDERFNGCYFINERSAMKHRVQLERWGDFASGITDEDVRKADAETIRYLWQEYEGPVSLGNLLDLVWVADESQVRKTAHDDALGAADRLGLKPHHRALQVGQPCVGFRYERSVLGSDLYVLRVLDALDFDWFRPTTDCNAPCGRTRPLNGPPDNGLDEAVHGRLELQRSDVIVDILGGE